MNDWTSGNSIERQRDVPPLDIAPPPPPVTFPTPPPDTQFLGAPISQLPGYTPPPQPQIVDRQAYWTAIQQKQQQELEAAQQLAQHFGYLSAVGQQFGRENDVNAAERQFAAGLPPSGALGAPVQPSPLQQVERPQPSAPGIGGFASNLAGGLGETLNTTVPGLPAVQSAVGNAAAKMASLPAPWDLPAAAGVPYAPDTRPFREAAARFIGEAIIPTHVWDTALTLIPAAKARTPIELASGVLLGDTGALDALRSAGKRLGESELVERGLARLADETGAIKRGAGAKFTVGDNVMWNGRPHTIIDEDGVIVTVRDVETGATQRVGRTVLRQDNPIGIPKRIQEAVGPLTPNAETLDEFRRRIQSERGMAKIPGPGEEAAKAAGEAASALSSEPTIQSLQERRTAITKALRVLQAPSKAEEKAAVQAELTRQLEQLPPVNQKLVQTLIETTPSKGERAAITEAQRARQAAGAASAFEGTGTEAEKAAAAYKAMGGKQAQRFTPVGERFTPAETGDLYSQLADAHANGDIGVFDRANAASALSLLMTGERLPGVASEATKPLNLMPHEIKLLGKIFGPEVEATLPKAAARSGVNRIIDILNLPRALVTAVDLSAAGRQGILLAPRNPIEFGKSWVPMIKAMASPEGFQRTAATIQHNPKFEDALTHGLELTDVVGAGLKEEPFASGLIEKIPSKLGGGLIRGSERGFVTFLDTLRMLSYEKYANRIERLAGKEGWNVERTDLVKSQVARFLNHASGRGSVGGLGEYTPAMNAVFFSPRFFLSRPQSVWDMVRPGADPVTRQVAFENLGAFVGMGVGMLATAKALGASVELDPRSSDFGKMRVGDTRIDFWGGYQPIARYIAQAATAKNKELFTGNVKYVYPGQTALRFFRSKLSPAGSEIYDYTVGQGKNYNGDDLFFTKPGWGSAWNDFAQKVIPLSIQDAISGYQQAGLGGALVAGGVSTVGGGVSSFGASDQQKQTMQLQDFTSKLSGARIDKGEVYPTVLDSDFKSQAWRDQFAGDFDELGDLSRFGSLADMRKAYVEYWSPKSDLSKDEISTAFDKHDSVKLWDKNVQQEKLDWWRQNADKVDEARKNNALPSSTILKAIGQ